MTIVDILSKLVGPAKPLIAFLEKVAAEYPDLAPAAQEWLTKLRAGVAVENLAALGAVIPQELLALAQGKIDPRKHPSDLA